MAGKTEPRRYIFTSTKFPEPPRKIVKNQIWQWLYLIGKRLSENFVHAAAI